MSLYLEILGYLASVIVALSLMMKSIIKLRWFNLAGASFMSLYGFLIVSYPVAFLNLFIALVNIFYLCQLHFKKEFFKLLEMPADRVYLDYFLNYYKDDIIEYFPGFQFEIKQDNIHLLVLRNLIPAGLFIGRRDNDDLIIEIEYTIEEYRDSQVGKYLFNDQISYFQKKGFRRIISPYFSKSFNQYLKKIGFRDDQANVMIKDIPEDRN